MIKLGARRYPRGSFTLRTKLAVKLLLVLEQGCAGFSVGFAFVGITKFTHGPVLFLRGAPPCGIPPSVP